MPNVGKVKGPIKNFILKLTNEPNGVRSPSAKMNLLRLLKTSYKGLFELFQTFSRSFLF